MRLKNEKVVEDMKRERLVKLITHEDDECNLYCDPPIHAVSMWPSVTHNESMSFEEQLRLINEGFRESGIQAIVRQLIFAKEPKAPPTIGYGPNGKRGDFHPNGHQRIAFIEMIKDEECEHDTHE